MFVWETDVRQQSVGLVAALISAFSSFDQHPVILAAYLPADPPHPVFLFQPASTDRTQRIFIALY